MLTKEKDEVKAYNNFSNLRNFNNTIVYALH